MEKIRAKIADRAHQQATRTAAFDDEPLAICVARCDEMFRGRDEIGEGVALIAHAPGIVPGLAEFAASADVRDSEDDAAVEEAETIRIEIDRHGNTIAAVPVEQQRSAAVTRRVFSIDDR